MLIAGTATRAGDERWFGMAIVLDEQAALRAAVRDLLDARCGETEVRRVMAGAEGFDRDLWAELAGIGVTGMLVGDEYGGTGLGPVEAEAVAEEFGAALLPAPFLGSAVLATALIQAAGTTEDLRRLLPGLAAGTSIATVAITGPRGHWTPEDVTVEAADDGSLTGRAHFVLFGQVADVVLVVAQRRTASASSKSTPAFPVSTVPPSRCSTRPCGCPPSPIAGGWRRRAREGSVKPWLPQASSLGTDTGSGGAGRRGLPDSKAWLCGGAKYSKTSLAGCSTSVGSPKPESSLL